VTHRERTQNRLPGRSKSRSSARLFLLYREGKGL
jgi:hypothetical protein